MGALGSIDYIVVFDLETAGYREWSICLAPLLLLVLGGVLLILFRGRQIPALRRQFVVAAMAAGGLLSGGLVALTYTNYKELLGELRSGQLEQVEGMVENYVASPRIGRPHEAFDVGGHSFEYADSDTGPGFHRTRSRGGPICSGRRVRIWHSEGTIVRLEVER